MKGVGHAHAVTQPQPLLLGLLACGRRFCMRPVHARHRFLVCCCHGNGHCWVRGCAEKATLKDGEDLVPADRFPQLIHPGGQLVNLSKQRHVAACLPRAPGERVDKGRVGAPGHLDGQVLEEVLGLPLEGGVEHRYGGGPLHVFEDLVEQDQDRASSSTRGEQRVNDVLARCHAVLIVFCHQGKGVLRVDLPGEPAPHGVNRAAVFQGFAVAGIELLAIEHRCRHVLRPRELPGFREMGQGVRTTCRMQQSR